MIGRLLRRPRRVAGIVGVVHSVVVVALVAVRVLLAREGLPVAHGHVVVGVRLVPGAPVSLGGDLNEGVWTSYLQYRVD